MQVAEKEEFYQIVTSCDATNFWYGPHLNEPLPDKKAFFEDFEEYYFTDFKNSKGRSFHIVEGDSNIGQINYNEIKEDVVDIDIIIYNKDNWSKGYGSSSVKLISAYLEEKFNVASIFIDVHCSTERAVKAYEKAGFTKSEKIVEKGESFFRLKRINKYRRT